MYVSGFCRFLIIYVFKVLFASSKVNYIEPLYVIHVEIKK